MAQKKMLTFATLMGRRKLRELALAAGVELCSEFAETNFVTDVAFSPSVRSSLHFNPLYFGHRSLRK
jgi:hypothetical protein